MFGRTAVSSGRPAPTGHGPVFTYAGIFVSVCANFAAFGVVVPVVPWLVTNVIGGSAALVGAAFAIAAVAAMLVRPVAGILAQRHGPRRTMIVGSALATLAAAAYALPFGEPGLLVVRIAIGAAEALVMTAGAVWTVSLASPQRRARMIGTYGLAMWSGLAIGPAIGDAVFGAGYPWVWAAAAGMSGFALLVLITLPGGRHADADVSTRLLPRAAILPGLALAAGGFGYACVVSFGTLAMAERGVGGGAMLVSLFSAAYVVVRMLGSGLADRFGPLRLIIVAGGLEAFGLTFIAVAQNVWLAGAGAVIAGGGFTLLYPSLAVIAVASASESERGATLGAVSSFFDLAIVVAGLGGGVLAAVSYPAVFGIAAALALSAIAAAGAAHRRTESEAARPPSGLRRSRDTVHRPRG
ncbi:MAG: MFS transporter [Microlunatus sp.]